MTVFHLYGVFHMLVALPILRYGSTNGEGVPVCGVGLPLPVLQTLFLKAKLYSSK